MAAGFAAAAVGGTAAAYEIGKFADHSVKAAASFQQANTLLTTQAGVAQSRIKGLGDAFLELAPRLAQTPQTLSEAFYHVASAGIPVREQLATLKAAAEGAAIGNANLEDTTNSLVAAIRSGIGGIHGARDAMATLMAIVGTGNMRLDEFNAAMGTGLPGTAKTFGLSLQSVGAALAFLTDTGMPASQAATRLRMSIALLGGPTEQSANVLKGLGLTSTEVASRFAAVSQMLEKAHVTTTQLAADMRKPDGLVVALRDLKTRMDEAGLSASTQADVIARAFGGGHMGSAIMQLAERLPAVQQKFTAINSSVSQFGSHWQQTTKTAVFQAHSMHAAFASIGTSIGTALLPAVQKLLAALVPLISKVAEFVSHHKTLSAIILGVAFGFSVLAAVIGTLGLAFMALDTAAAPWILLAVAIVAALAAIAYGVYEVVKHWGTIVRFFEGLWNDVKRIFREALDYLRDTLEVAWNRVYSDAVAIFTDLKGWFSTIWGDIRNEAISMWTAILSFIVSIWQGLINAAVTTWDAIKSFFEGLWNDVKAIFGDVWDGIKDVLTTVWDAIKTAAEDTWNAIVSFFTTIWNGLRDAAQATWSAIESGASAAWNGIKSVLSSIWSALQAAGNATWNGLKIAATDSWNATKAAAEAIWGALKSFFTAWWDGVKILSAMAWDAIKTAAVAVWNAMKVAAIAVWDALKAATIASWNGIKDAATAIWGAMKVAAVAVWGAIQVALITVWNLLVSSANKSSTAMKAVWDAALKWFGSFKSTVVGYFKDAGRWLFNAGEAILQGLWNGMKSVWNSMTGWLSSIGGVIKSLKGPIDKDMVLLQPEGQAIIQGLQAGMQQQMGALTAFVSKIAPGVQSTVGATITPGSAVAGGAAGGTVIFDLRGTQVMKDSDLQDLVNRVGRMLATQMLPMSGMQVRRA